MEEIRSNRDELETSKVSIQFQLLRNKNTKYPAHQIKLDSIEEAEAFHTGYKLGYQEAARVLVRGYDNDFIEGAWDDWKEYLRQKQNIKELSYGKDAA